MGITVDGKTLFELPIYRVSEEQYYKSFSEHYEKEKYLIITCYTKKSLNQNLRKDFGGDQNIMKQQGI